MWGQLFRILSPLPLTTVIIPTHNEAECIASTVNLARSRASSRTEVFVADGNSSDETRKLARAAGARVFRVKGGRGAQLNAAAKCARSQTIFILHADTQVPEGYDSEIHRVLGDKFVAGAFRLGTDSTSIAIHIVRAMANWRAQFLQRPYGDQGLFMTRRTFDSVGGYPNMPFLDDYEMVRKLTKRGRIAIARPSVITSARRWETLGVVRTTLMNQAVILAYHLGVSVETLQDWYRDALISAKKKTDES